MELKELKKAWSSVSSKENLDESQIREMLQKRTGSLIERIDRNIKIGFVLLFVLILLFILDDYVFSSRIIEEVGTNYEIPKWLYFLSGFSNALILTTFIYFVVKYYRVKKSCDITCDLRESLRKIINTLQIYKRLFYLALVTFSVAIAISFITGMYTGMEESAAENGFLMSEIPAGKLILAVLLGLVVLVILVGSVFLLMQWVFRKLYGNYLQKLKVTLNELDEVCG